MDYKTTVELLVNELKGLHGLSKIISYSSVARGTPHSNSGINIAIIVDDSMRFFPLDAEGYPLLYSPCLEGIREKYEIQNIGVYWESDYESEISLGGVFPNDTGEVVFERKPAP